MKLPFSSTHSLSGGGIVRSSKRIEKHAALNSPNIQGINMVRKLIFDTSILQEPASTIPSRKTLVHSQDTAVATALATMHNDHCSSVIVTRTGRKDSPVVGIFTERDVVARVIDQPGELALLPLREVMTPDPVVGSPESTFAWLLHSMRIKGLRHIPIVDADHHPLYVISMRDIVTLLVDSFPPNAIE
jgi:CBS domain-containing protein